MFDMTPQIADRTLMRPALLAKAARHGARQYRRSRDLPAALPGRSHGRTAEIVAALSAAEARCEEDRIARSPAYRPSRHVQVLSALIAEQATIADQV